MAEWKARALAEKPPTAGLTALLALARCGARETQPALLAAAGEVSAGRVDRGTATGPSCAAGS